MADKKKKKGTKMSLVDFLADASGGSSWANEGGTHDDFVLPSAPMGGPDDFMSGSRPDFSGRSSFVTPIDFSKLPKNPPFTAYLGNLPFDTEAFDIEEGLKDCKVVNVNLAKDKNDGRFRGFAYVEFLDLDSLKRALDMNGTLSLQGRKIRFDIAEPPKSGTGMSGASRSSMRPGNMSRMSGLREGSDSVGSSLDLGAWRRAEPLPEEQPLTMPRSTRNSVALPMDDSRRERSTFRSELTAGDATSRPKSMAATGASTWRSSHGQIDEPMSSSSMHSSTMSSSSRSLFSHRPMESSASSSRESRAQPERDAAPSNAERAASWRK